jgi:hypothetical protein
MLRNAPMQLHLRVNQEFQNGNDMERPVLMDCSAANTNTLQRLCGGLAFLADLAECH